MQRDDREFQARSFADWYEDRHLGRPWLDAFAEWGEHREYATSDEWAIRNLAEAELIARGVLVPPPDYHPGEAA